MVGLEESIHRALKFSQCANLIINSRSKPYINLLQEAFSDVLGMTKLLGRAEDIRMATPLRELTETATRLCKPDTVDTKNPAS